MNRQSAASAKLVILIDRIYSKYPLVDDFGTFEWPRASDLEELVVGSGA